MPLAADRGVDAGWIRAYRPEDGHLYNSPGSVVTRLGPFWAGSVVLRVDDTHRARASALPDDDVDQLPAARDDDAVRCTTSEDRRDPWAALRRSLDLILGRVRVDDDPVAKLAVDLDRDLMDRHLDRRGVDGRPRLPRPLSPPSSTIESRDRGGGSWPRSAA